MKRKLCIKKVSNTLSKISIEEIISSPIELEWVGSHIEGFFQKRYPNFSRKVSEKINSWCSNNVDDSGWHPNFFEGIILILVFAYVAVRSAILLLSPWIVMLLIFMIFKFFF